MLELGPQGLSQYNQKNVCVAVYPYSRIRQIYRVNDTQGAFVLEVDEQLRRHMFASQDSEDLIKEMRQLALDCMGVLINMGRDQLSFDDFLLTRLGLCRWAGQ